MCAVVESASQGRCGIFFLRVTYGIHLMNFFVLASLLIPALRGGASVLKSAKTAKTTTLWTTSMVTLACVPDKPFLLVLVALNYLFAC